jgi:hypothetical protein
MKQSPRHPAALAVTLVSTLLLAYSPGAVAKKEKRPARTGPDSVVVLIGNRMFPDFGEILSTGLHRRQVIGDTEFSFEVTRFYPHFSINDSTRAIVSLSDEPKNPAFRVLVFNADSLADSTWAFYNLDIPHFSRSSPLWFRVLQFDYRGEVYRKDLAPGETDRGKDKP